MKTIRTLLMQNSITKLTFDKFSETVNAEYTTQQLNDATDEQPTVALNAVKPCPHKWKDPATCYYCHPEKDNRPICKACTDVGETRTRHVEGSNNCKNKKVAKALWTLDSGSFSNVDNSNKGISNYLSVSDKIYGATNHSIDTVGTIPEL